MKLKIILFIIIAAVILLPSCSPSQTSPPQTPSPQEQAAGLQQQLTELKNMPLYQTFVFDSSKSGEITWTLKLPLEMYTDYRNRPRPESLYDYNLMAVDPDDRSAIDVIVRQVQQVVAENNLGKIDEIHLVLAFTQSLVYAHDDISTGQPEYPRFPVETLVERTGDCEDTSILAAAILNRMGYDVALILFEQLDHMGLGINYSIDYGNSWIYEGRRYWYLDASGKRSTGWAPDEYAQTSAYILPVR